MASFCCFVFTEAVLWSLEDMKIGYALCMEICIASQSLSQS